MDPPWLRFFTSKTKTRLGPGKKYTLDGHLMTQKSHMGKRRPCAPVSSITGLQVRVPTLVTIFDVKDHHQFGSWEKVHFGRTF